MLNLYQSLEQYDPEQDYILALVTHTEGSTYQKIGAMMLISPSLDYWGLISGGCLEGDILQHSREILTTTKDKALVYDMRGDDDLDWGLGSGCNGAIHLYLKFLPAKAKHFGFFEVLTAVRNGKAHWLNLSVEDQSLEFLEMPTTESLHPDEKKRPKYQEKYLQVPLLPPTRLLICGASPDAAPVSQLAKAVNWQTTLIDHRQDFALPAKFPDANKVQLVKRSQWENFSLTGFDAAVIMSHQFERDRDYLARLITSDIPYIGLLGPSRRREQLLANCKTTFSPLEGRLFGPVGLDIGADTPETIALAIIAEIQAVKAGKTTSFCYQDKSR